ncbi:hypothetical protein N7474_002531 [Penicillium riverlandense]|uniref:uncharacterized protein n=1 Tax=Penicillium riverlandense TaxID=1903569 RepID=UPI0025498BBB|nr:uncharacterized protein N7474_002531 [Penicillium riverlandense]KAJ5825393.1 hypothetical protein N7474_002531 [Penicillium riverlandense]
MSIFIDTGDYWTQSQPAGTAENAPTEVTNSRDSPEIIDLTLEDEVEIVLPDKLTRECRISGFNPADFLTDGQYIEYLQHLEQLEQQPKEVPEVVVDYVVYKPGVSVLLQDDSFLRIEKVLQKAGEVNFHGRRLFANVDPRVTNHIEHGVPKKYYELVWIAHEDEPISLNQVKRICNIRFTNLRTTNSQTDLTCRLKLTFTPKNVAGTTKDEYAIEYLSYVEADEGFRMSSVDLRTQWRGHTVRFGEAELSTTPSAAIDIDHPTTSVVDLTDEATRTYTFGDAFCGAGGLSCGAREAGLSIRWAFDLSTHAITTYGRNFPGVLLENASIYDFLTNDDAFLRVDVLHCSPPCQPFSPAHTVNCDRDDANSACVFSCENLLLRAKPRVLTIEETHGLAERHKLVFGRVILDLVENGYSVRWAILDCLNYGVPQSRKRLCIIAAGPGEALPRLPLPTHGDRDNLQPFASIYSAIHDIPDDADDHDLPSALERYRLLGYRNPYDEHGPARTITCGGGEFNYHPTGKRVFTTREFACLQTFPLEFQFSEREARKQIGNAVPPRFAAAIYRQLYHSLRETDRRESLGDRSCL